MRTPKFSVPILIGFGLILGILGCSQTPLEKPTNDALTSNPRSSDPRSSDIAPEPIEQLASIDDLIRTSEQSLADGRFEDARTSLRRGLLLDPEGSRLRFLFAQAEAGTGNLDGAIEILGSIDPNDPEFGIASLGQSAQWLAAAGRAAEARIQYEKALEMAPEVEFLRHQYAAFLNFVGWRYRARDVLEPLVTAGNASAAELRSLLDVSNSYAATQASSMSTPEHREGPLSESLGRLSRRQPRIAVDILTAMLDQGLMKRESTTEAAIAAGFAELQQFDEMSKWLSTSSSAVIDNPLFWRAIGDQRLFDGKVDQAVACYLKSIQADCTNPIVYERLTSAMLRLGDNDAAKRIDRHRDLLLSISPIAETLVTQPQTDDGLVIELASKLERVGQPIQAAAWLSWFRSEHPSLIRGSWWEDEIERLRRTDGDVTQAKRFVGLAIDGYPLPSAPSLLADEVDGTTRPESPTDSSSIDSERTVATMVDVAAARGLIHEYLNADPKRSTNFRIFEGLGGGIAAFDFDRDGQVDFYCCQGGCEPPDGKSNASDQFFRNVDGKFRDTTEAASLVDRNYTQCVTTGDINQDGFDDVIVGNLGLNRMLINQGDGTFHDVSETVGWTNPSSNHYTMGLAVADVTGDAIPDVVEVNYVNSPSMYQPSPIGPDGGLIKIPGPLNFPAEVDRVWIQEGRGTFQSRELGEESQRSGNGDAAQFGDAANPGLGLIVSNFDNDAANEIFVANDARPNQLWKQRGNASQVRFDDVAVARGCAVSSRGEACACMGVGWADFDRNGSPDMMVTNWFDEWLNYYQGDSQGNFHDTAPRFGLDRLSENLLGFGCQAIDFDNDAAVDVFVANGHIDQVAGAETAMAMPAQLIENLGDRFLLAEQSDETYWRENHLGRAAIATDFNRDGRLDIAVVDLLAPVALLENQTKTDNHWIQIVLVGVASERGAIGARVEVSHQGNRQVAVTATGDGYQSRNDAVIVFGLGANGDAVDVQVKWPSGKISTLPSLRSDTRFLVVEDQSEAWVDRLD
ncbi:ASPIC and UnbV [Rubripirellula tenax]|uniref:ASPIC and UnbV n=1 Tax=Rubripirellula tenax TaxID=2528015 RepID=A0A5C6EIE8_9BACT|nr:FG-GAP-like repeat-containing protein [Rubripirellula tenax]TWU48832.1 ASPIC and UnbV [Rubripirellula tenax]